jgi:nitroreductase
MTAAPSTAEFATTLVHARRTVLPRRLGEPGPDEGQLRTILDAAAAAPDHRQLLPWRFVLVPAQARARLGDAFAAALLERDAGATQEQQAEARGKAFRAPALLLAIARTSGGDEEITALERVVSAGCAIQNMLLVATALGFASSLTSGKALRSRALRELFAITDEEEALCFITVGTPVSTGRVRQRPAVDAYVSTLGPACG